MTLLAFLLIVTCVGYTAANRLYSEYTPDPDRVQSLKTRIDAFRADPTQAESSDPCDWQEPDTKAPGWAREKAVINDFFRKKKDWDAIGGTGTTTNWWEAFGKKAVTEGGTATTTDWYAVEKKAATKRGKDPNELATTTFKDYDNNIEITISIVKRAISGSGGGGGVAYGTVAVLEIRQRKKPPVDGRKEETNGGVQSESRESVTTDASEPPERLLDAYLLTDYQSYKKDDFEKYKNKVFSSIRFDTIETKGKKTTVKIYIKKHAFWDKKGGIFPVEYNFSTHVIDWSSPPPDDISPLLMPCGSFRLLSVPCERVEFDKATDPTKVTERGKKKDAAENSET